MSDLLSGSGLMLALDLEDASEAEEIIAVYRRYIDAVKLGTILLVSPTGGMGLISRIKNQYRLPVLVDAKLKDVAHVMLSTARSYKAHGAGAITCWHDVGEKAIKFLIDSLQGEIDIVILSALTSLQLHEIYDSATRGILSAIRAGCKIIQIPGNYPELIKWARGNIPDEVRIVSCGVGTQGGIIGNAIECGADYEIIGRRILDSDNIEESFIYSFEKIHHHLELRKSSLR